MSTEPLGTEAMGTAEYREVVGRHPGGVAVVTLDGPGGLVAFTASSVLSVSSTPPVLAFCVSTRSSSWPALAGAETVVVNLLAQDQEAVARRFAERDVDRFAGGGWTRLASGEPVLDGTREWVRGRVLERVPLGSSILVALAVLERGGERPDAGPLLYAGGAYHRLEPLAPPAS